MTFSWSGVCSSPPHSSLGFASSQWVPEITHHCPRTPFLLVGTQVDLRDDSNTLEKLAKNKQRALTCESGEKLARELKAVKYVECSALTQVRREEEEEVPCFIGRSKDTWAASTQEIMTLLWNKLADNSDFRGLFYTSRCGCDYSVISRLIRSVLVINRKWPGFFFFFINLEKGFWKMTGSARISAEHVRSKCTDTEYVSRCSC